MRRKRIHRSRIPEKTAGRVYSGAEWAAARRGHRNRTRYSGIGGLVGGILGSFGGLWGAAAGAAIGAGIGAAIGDEVDSG